MKGKFSREELSGDRPQPTLTARTWEPHPRTVALGLRSLWVQLPGVPSRIGGQV